MDPASSNQTPRFWKLIFEDSFDAETLSPSWESIWPTQWVQDGWLHTRDNNGWPRDSEALVHDGDVNWRNYSVSLTAGFTPGTPWDNFNVLLRASGFRRSSTGGEGNAYQLNFNGSRGWGSGGHSVSLTRSQGRQNTDLFVRPWSPVGPSANIVSSLYEGHIQVSVDGIMIIDLVDPSPLLYGGIGVHAIWESEAQFDNIVVKDIFSQQGFKIAEHTAIGTAVGTMTAIDSDAGDTLFYTITDGNSDPDGDSNLAFAITPTTGVITVNDRDDLDFDTTLTFNLTVQVIDEGGLFDNAAIKVSLTNINESPIAADDTGVGYQTDEDKAFTTANVLSNDTDPDGDTLSVSSINTSGTKGIVTNNGNGTFNYNSNNKFSYLKAGEQAKDDFIYAVTDGHGGTDTTMVSINLTGVNDAPSFGNEDPVLWNRLGSQEEVHNSEVGANFHLIRQQAPRPTPQARMVRMYQA
jgi:VCBS repeat-containing protein